MIYIYIYIVTGAVEVFCFPLSTTYDEGVWCWVPARTVIHIFYGDVM